ncbi:MAG: response regulator transcription factor [Bacteroidetes bacterium]|nr:response regulator transcription factor [Bacteroidota bacterium]
MIEIIIVDDHQMFRMGVRMYIELKCNDICVVGEAESGQKLLLLPQLATASVVVLDIEMPGMNGIEAARRLKSTHPDLKILAVSALTSQEVVEAMINVGVNGFISKSQGDYETLADAVRTVADGYEYFGADISKILFNTYVAAKKTVKVTSEFTAQERQIIELCGEGLSVRKIAAQLFISRRTVENHKQRIFEKLGIHSTGEMIRYAMVNKIIRVEN